MGVIMSNQKRRRGRMLSEPAAAVDETFDPGKFSIAVVLDYVENHPGERAAVRTAEQNGKARVSLLAALAD